MAKDKGHIPIRTCIACGKKRNKKDLIRLVLDSDGWIVVDGSGCAPGRGAYICKNKECWSGLQNRKVLARAFRGKGRLMFRSDPELEIPNVIQE
ncbi:MAG: DUF448 domain-containing protein [Deltaproteobacteria bacterium]|nr:MAG: DUF448 domain-containing protein [Deltaproteobacteria bacterium]